MATTPVFWPGEFHGLYSPWGHEELVTTERFSCRTSGLIFFALILTLVLDVVLIFVSYMPILCVVFHIPSQDAPHKALSTCDSHTCVIILFYGPGIFSVLTQWFGYLISLHIYSLLANVYILIPPTLNPMVYGIKTKQIRDLVVHLLFPKQK